MFSMFKKNNDSGYRQVPTELKVKYKDVGTNTTVEDSNVEIVPRKNIYNIKHNGVKLRIIFETNIKPNTNLPVLFTKLSAEELKEAIKDNDINQVLVLTPHIYTPLIHTVLIKNTENVKILLDAGADINLGGTSTPLMEAIKNDSIDIVELLLLRGADTLRKSINNETAYSLSRNKIYEIQYLVEFYMKKQIERNYNSNLKV